MPKAKIHKFPELNWGEKLKLAHDRQPALPKKLDYRELAERVSRVYPISYSSLAVLTRHSEPPPQARTKLSACLLLLTYGYDPADFGIPIESIPQLRGYGGKKDPVHPRGRALTLALGDGSTRVDEDAGWTVVSRPKRVGVTEWTGTAPTSIVVPSLLDGFTNDRSVESDITYLRSIMRAPVAGQPTLVRLDGPLPLNHLIWFVGGLTWGDEVRRDDGHRTRAFVEITFTEYVVADLIVGSPKSPAEKAQERAGVPAGGPAGGAGGNRTYTVRSGDTLATIAAKQLGSANRWREIANLNGIRDPKRLKVGSTLRLP